MDLLVACSLGVMLNVFCHMTYSAPGLDRRSKMNNVQLQLWNEYDVNGLSEDARKLLCLTRGQSIEIVSWLSIMYSTGISDMPVQEVFSAVLVNICKMLCNYKWQADRKKVDSFPDFTIGRLKTQIHTVLTWAVQILDPSLIVFSHLDWEPKNWKFPLTDSTTILPHMTGLNIRKSSAISFQRKSLSELFTQGETSLDQKFSRRLEIKRETIGLSYIDIVHIFDTHVRFFRRRQSPPPSLQ